MLMTQLGKNITKCFKYEGFKRLHIFNTFVPICTGSFPPKLSKNSPSGVINFSTHNGSHLLPHHLVLEHCRAHSSMTKTEQLPLTDRGRISNCYFLLLLAQRKRLSAVPAEGKFRATSASRPCFRTAAVPEFRTRTKTATSFEFLIKQRERAHVPSGIAISGQLQAGGDAKENRLENCSNQQQ